MRIFMLLSLCALAGCRTRSQVNPFSSFSEKDIAKIVICFGKAIYGPDKSFDNPEEPNDYAFPVQFYLEPSGYAIKDRRTISKLYNAGKAITRDTGGYPLIGVLSSQVFLDKRGEILGATHIVNWKGFVVFDSCFIKNGWIHLNEDETAGVFAGRSPEYCRIIYDFMKKNMPDKIDKLNKLYKEQGGLEKLLFGKNQPREVKKLIRAPLSEPVSEK